MTGDQIPHLKLVKKAIYKVPNGKLLKIFMEDDGKKITAIKVTGDFFLYPEENVEILEKALIGVNIEPEALGKSIRDFLGRTKTSFFGIDEASLVLTIQNAKNAASVPVI